MSGDRNLCRPYFFALDLDRKYDIIVYSSVLELQNRFKCNQAKFENVCYNCIFLRYRRNFHYGFH